MMKYRHIRHRLFVPLLMLAVGLAGTGVTYAKWSNGLQMTGAVTTGMLEAVYSDNVPCTISVVDADGTVIEEAEEVLAAVSGEGKSINVTAAVPMSVLSLTEDGDRMIRLQCPLEKGINGTLDRVQLSPVDTRKEPEEQITMEPSGITLLLGGSEEFELTGDQAPGYDMPLQMDVFRGIEEQDGNLYAVACLRLTEESRERLAELPSELVFNEEELPFGEEVLSVEEVLSEEEVAFEEELPSEEELLSAEAEGEVEPFDAEVAVTYRCSLALYIEQAYDNSVVLPKGAGSTDGNDSFRTDEVK